MNNNNELHREYTDFGQIYHKETKEGNKTQDTFRVKGNGTKK